MWLAAAAVFISCLPAASTTAVSAAAAGTYALFYDDCEDGM
jgi:hypothetical protein